MPVEIIIRVFFANAAAIAGVLAGLVGASISIVPIAALHPGRIAAWRWIGVIVYGGAAGMLLCLAISSSKDYYGLPLLFIIWQAGIAGLVAGLLWQRRSTGLSP